MVKKKDRGTQSNIEMNIISQQQINDISQIKGIGPKKTQKIKDFFGRTSIKFLKKQGIDKLRKAGLPERIIKIITK